MDMKQDKIMEKYHYPIYRKEKKQFVEQYAGREDGFLQWASGENPFCGDSLRIGIWLSGSQKDIIQDICYDGYGCSLCIASAETLLETIKGSEVSTAEKINIPEILYRLGNISISQTRMKCVELPITMLGRALQKS